MASSAAFTAAFAAAIAATFATVSTVMSAALTATSQLFDKLLDLFLGSLPVLNHVSFEVQGFPSQRVVGVDGHAVILDLHHLSHEVMAFGIIHRDDGTLEDMLVVELAVDGENITLQLVSTLWNILPEGFGWLKDEVKLRPLLQIDEVLLKGIEGDTISGDELEGVLRAGLFLQRLFSIGDGVQLVCN